MERSLSAVLAAVGFLVACSKTSIGERHIVDGTATGGTGDRPTHDAGAGSFQGAGGANGESGGTPAGGVSAAGGISNTGGSNTAQCGCPLITLASDQLFPGEIVVDATTAYWVVRDGIGIQDASILKVPLTGGTPVPVASAQDGLDHIAADSTSIYWTMHDAIRKAPIAGGPWVQLAQGSSAYGIAIDATNVYWTSYEAVFKVPISGGDPVQLATVPGVGCGSIKADATHVYWVNRHNNEAFASLPTVMKVPIAGGATTSLAPGGLFEAEFIAVDQDRVYWAQFDRFRGDAGDIVGVRSALLSVPLAGGEPVELASRPAWPRAFALDGTQLYWGTSSTSIATGSGSLTDGAILKTARGGVTTVIADGLEAPGGIATNGTEVCWTRDTIVNSGRAGSVVCLKGCECP